MPSRKRRIGLSRELPYKDLTFAKVDLHRSIRRNFPEVIYAKGKTVSQVAAIAQALREKDNPVLVTKVSPAMAESLKGQVPWLRYFPQAQMMVGHSRVRRDPGRRSVRSQGAVLVMTAGTSDIPVAEEARVTLREMGQSVTTLFDVGVAGLQRLVAHLRLLRRARVIVVIAGMDGVLPSVVSGLVGCPVVAVPTSVGYGASFQGVAPLLTMLNSCSPGVAVVNIDNGFGAGYLAALIARNR